MSGGNGAPLALYFRKPRLLRHQLRDRKMSTRPAPEYEPFMTYVPRETRDRFTYLRRKLGRTAYSLATEALEGVLDKYEAAQPVIPWQARECEKETA